MLCTYYSKAISIGISVWQSILRISHIMKPLGFNANISATKKKKVKKKKLEVVGTCRHLKVKQIRCGLSQRGRGERSTCLTESACWWPARGRDGGTEEEVVCGSTRGAQRACCSRGWRAWERQPSKQSQLLFSGGQTSKWTWLCPFAF